jgi:hypothetical protein
MSVYAKVNECNIFEEFISLSISTGPIEAGFVIKVVEPLIDYDKLK